jgi:exopolysaccharide biosynthesis protein YbjH
VTAPVPIQPRPDRATSPEYWDTAWATSTTAPVQLRDLLAAQLAADGLVLENLELSANSAELRFRNERYQSYANAIGRAARAMTRVLPSSVETFRLVPVAQGMALSAVTIRRSDLEALEFTPDAAAAIEAVSGFGDAPALAPGALGAGDLYPRTGWSLEPYFSAAYFDPDRPFRLDVGAALVGSWQPAPGWLVSGTIRQRIAGNVKGGRPSNSVLPHVRTDRVLYAQYGTTLNDLYASYQWRPGRDLYGRVTAGYLEMMFGGVSAELLWKPVTSRLGLGIEANWVKQRDYDQRFGFLNYSVATGQASAYYDFGNGLVAQVDAGRYLAGDVGATFSLDRKFDNGWSVGGFFTKTNVSAADFGEGSFDKGIRFEMPLNWFLGKPSREAFGITVRPVQRDGGAQLIVPNRLYGQVSAAHRRALRSQKARFWE